MTTRDVELEFLRMLSAKQSKRITIEDVISFVDDQSTRRNVRVDAIALINKFLALGVIDFNVKTSSFLYKGFNGDHAPVRAAQEKVLA